MPRDVVYALAFAGNGKKPACGGSSNDTRDSRDDEPPDG
jgi:hypothetical protein